jgi:signal transduction histidine kinase
MRSFAVQVSEAKNFELHIAENKDMPNMPLDMYERKNLYLVFKEAVNNAAKYSACKNLWIEFSNKNNLLEMKIKDDGVGFSILSFENVAGIRHGGNGITNMKKRAGDLKSDLEIISEPGQGTEIVLRINLR